MQCKVEPRLLMVTEPRTNYNSIFENYYVNIVVIEICNKDNNFKYILLDISWNNRIFKTISMIWYLLIKTVLEVKKDIENFKKNAIVYINPDLMINKKAIRKNG